MAVSCYKMLMLLNSAQKTHTLSQHTNIQHTSLDTSENFKNGIFENSTELKLTLETMNKLNKLTLEMQLARDPSNCIGIVEYQLPLAGTRP